MKYLNKITLVLLYIIFASNMAKAEIIPLFNPSQDFETRGFSLNVAGFIANDSMSIKKFLHNWEDKKFYTPYDGENLAIGMSRVDIGTSISGYYVGYFYRNNLRSTYTKGFVDFYNLIKHHTAVTKSQYYNLKLDLDGIADHGIMIAKNLPFFEDKEHKLIMGVSAYLSYATKLQNRNLNGYAEVNPNNTYNMSFDSDYYYQNQLLKSLFTGRRKVKNENGFGYGLHYGLYYLNKKYQFDIQFIINDILARSRWSHAPYSNLHASSNNQVIDNRGYIEYNPTISGQETYKKYTYKVAPKYHLSFKKYFENSINATVGVEYVGNITIPYGSISKRFDGIGEVSIIYETKFKSKGISLKGKNYALSLMSESFSKTSAVSFSANITFNF